ncbi:LysR family transcriptional regulator [Streptomyces angustmyceticus]|uniref:LysR family transcriptional regulator n=1 Tax=Streptomyces angustmyceticus TaxID=285578 RepID=A0A5J4LM80_9ACTN|nr:LysR family transcriptional regulator [Streptomyces angustmyceticus]UAL67611.1 LysR family transcriptional regulator [Streptomyces angustmyceticus]GES31395.1 LysR family transcriptional regulator [Streptomyces angustmyceticus]
MTEHGQGADGQGADGQGADDRGADHRGADAPGAGDPDAYSPRAPERADAPWTASRPVPSVQQLESFLILAEELHFGRSAARLFVTQPALSRQLRSLEERLDVVLLQRSRRHVEITPAGAALLPKARAAVEAMAELCRAAGSHARQIEGRMVIGSIAAEAAMPYTRAVLDELHACHPRLRTSVRGLDLATHFGALERGEVDVLFLRPPVPPGIETLTLATEPRVACLPADDPLAGRDEVTLAELSGRPVVDVPPQCPRLWWRFWMADPRPDGSPVRYGPVAPDMEALLLAVSQGQAMAFLPAAARHFYPRPGLSYVAVPDLPPGTAALAWMARNRTLPTVAAIRRAAATVLRNAPPYP